MAAITEDGMALIFFFFLLYGLVACFNFHLFGGYCIDIDPVNSHNPRKGFKKLRPFFVLFILHTSSFRISEYNN
jgi:hypothetical protein